jgi:dTDP-glucose pyrophosphorylase
MGHDGPCLFFPQNDSDVCGSRLDLYNAARAAAHRTGGATVFAYRVRDSDRYGVVEF